MRDAVVRCMRLRVTINMPCIFRDAQVERTRRSRKPDPIRRIRSDLGGDQTGRVPVMWLHVVMLHAHTRGGLASRVSRSCTRTTTQGPTSPTPKAVGPNIPSTWYMDMVMTWTRKLSPQPARLWRRSLRCSPPCKAHLRATRPRRLVACSNFDPVRRRGGRGGGRRIMDSPSRRRRRTRRRRSRSWHGGSWTARHDLLKDRSSG